MLQNSSPPSCQMSDAAPALGVEVKDPASLRERLRHFTWAWYTWTMSTGGLALLIANQPHRFPGIEQVGQAVYILDLLFFALVCSLMGVRFILHGGFLDSLRHEREGLFFPTFWLSVATIISGLGRFFGDDDAAGDSGVVVLLEVLFWLYCACTLLVAVGQYYFLFSARSYRLQTMAPSWILPIFPVMLSGTIASILAEQQPPRAALPIICAGLTFQGLGFSVSFLMYAHYLGRLMESGLPARDHRPAMFICVGPPAFTALALIGMTSKLPGILENTTTTTTTTAMGHDKELAAQILALLAIACAIFLWALSLWFFSLAALAVARGPPLAFHLNWWAMVFPNTGFTLATISLGDALDSSAAVAGVATAMSLAVLCMYLFVLFRNLRAVLRREIVYPGKDEDVSD
ncbi:hypothetical protein AOCH_002106 [Aspergillus ochraceoroseus]|uniref:C4-dicarboxylate transporter/malic acid transport protein n=2 Tax=Aspergillus ochraceoroseus TaxID=138278 RepID=A0A0F8UXU2_9EURO|nr:hypothetical protein AOCH_002106 [Aspergillus ochraceoroseus]